MGETEDRQWIVHVDRRHCRVTLLGCSSSERHAPATLDAERSDEHLRVWVDWNGDVIAAEAVDATTDGTLDERSQRTADLVDYLRSGIGMGPGQFGVPTLWGPVPGYEDGYTCMFVGELNPTATEPDQRAGLKAAGDRARRNRERAR